MADEPGISRQGRAPSGVVTPDSVAIAATLELTTTFTDSGAVVRAGLPDLERPLVVGDVVGERYEIRNLLGHGGCGYVYAVHDRELDVDVALKTLRPDIRMEPDAVAQLKREIQMARRVTHSNVCRIFDVGFHRDGDRSTPFLTMEMLRGPTLADRLLERHTLTLEELERLTRQLLAGLDAAHRAGVVHADLKPGNIMLTETDRGSRAVITDFGLATAQTVDLNPEGYVLGTPAYMSPEQVEGKPLSPASDYYALGCTLYHAVTGDLPFNEQSAFATAVARLERDAVPPRQRVALPRSWDEIIVRLLTRQPAERLDGAGVLRILEPRRRRWWPLALAAAVAGVAVLAALIWSGRDRRDRLELSMPADPGAAHLVERAERLIALGAPSAAIGALEKARELSSEHPRIDAGLARAHYIYEPKAARSEARKAAELAAALAPDERKLYRALQLHSAGKVGEANVLLTELSRRYPGNFEIGFDLAANQRDSGAPGLARATLERLSPGDEVRALQVLWAQASIERDARNFTRALQLARELSARARSPELLPAHARAETLVSESLRQLGDLVGAEASGRLALELAERSGEPVRIAEAQSMLVAIAMSRGRYSEALVHLDGRKAALSKLGLHLEVARIGVTRSQVLADTGHTSDALELLDRDTIPVFRRESDVYWEGYALLVRAQIRRTRGEPSKALEDCRAGLAIFRAIQNRRITAFAQTICAVTLRDAGELEAAASALDEAISIRRELGLEVLVAQNRLDRAELALARGDPASAAAAASGAADFFASRSLRNDEAAARELVARSKWRAGDVAGARAEIARARARLEGESELLEQAIGITELVIAGGATAGDSLGKRIERLERGEYHVLAIETRLARSRIERDLGHRRRAAELGAAALAEARRRGLRPYRYVEPPGR